MRDELGRFIKGIIPWSKGKGGQGILMGWPKGKKMSKKHRENLSKSHKIAYNEGRSVPPNQTGFNHNEETRKKIGEAQRGEKYWNWKGGITPETRKRINKLEWKVLRLEIYQRDNWTCQKCKKHCHDDIQCHHIVRPEDGGTDNKTNLITLCKTCHLRTHNKRKENIRQ